MKYQVKDLNGRRFVLRTADSKAKRVYSKAHKGFVMSDIASVPETPLNTEWVATKGIVKDSETAFVVDHVSKAYGEYSTRYLNQSGIDRVKEFLHTHQSFTAPVKRGVYLSPEPKPAYRDLFTGTGSKDAVQSPIWGYQLAKTPQRARANRVEYQGIEYQEPLPNSVGDKYTPAVPPSLFEVTQFLPCGLATQKSCFVPAHAKRYMTKQSALDRVFVSRPIRPSEQVARALSLDTCPVDGNESHWIPRTENPIDLMSRNEDYRTRQVNARLELDRIKQLIGDKKFQLLVLAAEGLNAREIADKTGGSYDAIKKSLQRIRKQLMDAGMSHA